ncbi:MAG: hypothetical protein US18_C0008G0002 [Parcubacteria group bacterium GW2011_GWB1_36_5]|nr:MAG: hypothetical protein US18_C0008G0002 [Parcubacteria group bacterium GW2011_GWB1_36_5]
MTIGNVIDIYKKIYDLPELEYGEQVPDGFLKLYKENNYFVIVSIYNLKHEHLLIRDFNKGIGWELPGGSINLNESIENAVNRIVLKETNLEIDELSPVAIVKNIFQYGTQSIIHRGVAFMALSRGKLKSYSKNIQTHFSTEIPKKIAYQNDSILKLVRKKIDFMKYNPPFEEIDSIKDGKFFLFYLLHKYVVKYIGNFSSRKIKKVIFSLIEGRPKTILDVSCGDCPIINELCKYYNPDICIGNDISWKTITLLKKKYPEVIFTNHNVLDMPYKMKFDLVIFKNTLHHIEKMYQEKVLIDLKNLAKQLIIVDIDDPQNSSFLSKIWNNYYVYLLGDQGNTFLKFKKFKKIIETKSAGEKVTTGIIKTIKGDYFYATIKKLI